MTKLISTNPSNGEVLGEVEISTDDEIREKIELAHKSKVVWKELGAVKRVELLRKIYDSLKETYFFRRWCCYFNFFNTHAIGTAVCTNMCFLIHKRAESKFYVTRTITFN